MIVNNDNNSKNDLVNDCFIALCENRHREIGIAVLVPDQLSISIGQFSDSSTYINTINSIFINKPTIVLIFL